MKVNKKDIVKVEYVGKLKDGTIFDSSEKQGHPLEFKVGSGEVIKGFDEAVLGMKKDEEKKVKVKFEDGYGPVEEEFVRKISKNKIPEDIDVKKGDVLNVKTPTGEELPATVIEVKSKHIVVDMNSPLAGKDLFFKLKVLDINKTEK